MISKKTWIYAVLVAASLKIHLIFFLPCPNFVAKRNTLLNRDTNIDVAILDFKPAITCSKLTIKH